LFSIICISVLTETVCIADSRPVIRVAEGSHRKTLLILHPDLNGFLIFPSLYTHLEGHKFLYEAPEVHNVMRQDCITSRLYHQRLLIFFNLQLFPPPPTPPTPPSLFFPFLLARNVIAKPSAGVLPQSEPRAKELPCYFHT